MGMENYQGTNTLGYKLFACKYNNSLLTYTSDLIAKSVVRKAFFPTSPNCCMRSKYFLLSSLGTLSQASFAP